MDRGVDPEVEAEAAPPAPPRTSRRRLLVRLALMAALATGVILALGEILPGAGDRLAAADPGWLAVAAVVEAAAIAGYALVFRAVLAGRPAEVPRRRSAQIAVAELGAFAVVPTGAGGPAVRFWGLHREGLRYRDIGARSVAFAAVFNAPYVLAAVLLGLAAAASILPGKAPLGVALAPLGVIALTLLGAGALIVLARRTADDRPAAPRWRSRLHAVAQVVPDGLRAIPGIARRPGALGGALVFWAGDSLVLWAAFHAVGESPPLVVVALAAMLGQVGSISPLPGGVGGVEPTMVAILTASGVGLEAAAAAVVCYRAVTLGLQGVGGALALGAVAAAPGARAEAEAEAGRLAGAGVALPAPARAPGPAAN